MMIHDSEATLLLVEDDFTVRDAVRQMFERNGFTVLDCASGERAIEFVRAHAGPIDLLITDFNLPGLSGPETVDAVRLMRPSLPVLVIAKPFLAEQLLARVSSMLRTRFVGGVAQ